MVPRAGWVVQHRQQAGLSATRSQGLRGAPAPRPAGRRAWPSRGRGRPRPHALAPIHESLNRTRRPESRQTIAPARRVVSRLQHEERSSRRPPPNRRRGLRGRNLLGRPGRKQGRRRGVPTRPPPARRTRRQASRQGCSRCWTTLVRFRPRARALRSRPVRVPRRVMTKTRSWSSRSMCELYERMVSVGSA